MWATFVTWIAGAWAKVLAGLAIIVAIVFAIFEIRKSGETLQANSDMKKELDDVKVRNEIDTQVTNLPDGSATDQLRAKWSRD